MEFQNKTVLITASASGIGLAMALAFALKGAEVVVSSRSKDNVDAAVQVILSKGGKAVGIPCHVGLKEQRAKLIQQIDKRFGKLDILVTNAAISTAFGNSTEATEEQITKMWHVNYTSTFLLIKESLPLLAKGTSTNILVISSQSAFSPEFGKTIGHYAATKVALLYLVKLLAHELAPIRVNAIAPGLIKTKFSEGLWKGKQEETATMLGIARLGVPQDVAGTALYLCGKGAAHVTGQTIMVAGRPSPRL